MTRNLFYVFGECFIVLQSIGMGESEKYIGARNNGSEVLTSMQST